MLLDSGGNKKKKTGAAGSALKSGGAAGSSAKKKSSSSGSSSSGGGSVRNYSGGGSVGTTSSGQYSTPAPVPSLQSGGGPIPSIQAFLAGDIGFQQQNRQLNKTFGDFLADVKRRRASLTSEYGLSSKAMNDQKLKDLSDLEADYGARGLLRSGLYAGAVGDYNSEFSKRMADLERRQNEALTGLDTESSQFRAQTEEQKRAAKEAALRRRAEQYGTV